MPFKMKEKSYRINSKTTIHIVGADKTTDLNKTLWAINWFNAKNKNLYNLYGALAFPHVKKVGGAVAFKGKIRETLAGNNSLKRELLLVVSYPNADGFLGLFPQKLFLIKSLLRINAVKDFVFGFAKMTGGTAKSTQKPNKYKGDKAYLIHIVKGEKKEFSEKINTKTPAGITLFFDAEKTAYIGRSSDEGEVKKGQFFIDRIMIWEAQEPDELKDWVKSESFPLKHTEDKNHGIFMVDRLL